MTYSNLKRNVSRDQVVDFLNVWITFDGHYKISCVLGTIEKSNQGYAFEPSQSPQIIKIKNHMIFTPTSRNIFFFFFVQVCFFLLLLFFLLKRLGAWAWFCFFFLLTFQFLNCKALFPWMKRTVTGETIVTKMSLTFLNKTLEN